MQNTWESEFYSFIPFYNTFPSPPPSIEGDVPIIWHEKGFQLK